MNEKNSKKSDELQVSVYTDRQGRAWSVVQLWKPVKSCYSLKCGSKAVLEMSRIAGTLCRRELLCLKCFQSRQKNWGLQYKRTAE